MHITPNSTPSLAQRQPSNRPAASSAIQPGDSFQSDSREAEAWLRPQAVAVVGGTDKPGKPGNTILKNLLGGFQGQTYVVNARAAGQEMLGQPVYGSLKDIPGKVDLAVITIPGQHVEATIRDCAEKGIRNAVVISAGFGETEGMAARAEALKKTARELGVRMMGPNCLGLVSTQVGLNASFAVTPALAGSVALLSQSGGVMISMLGVGQEQNMGFSVLASMGNKMDLQESDLLTALHQDPQTKVICIYSEGIQDGPRFLETARQVAQDKPVLMLKGGRSSRGAQAASSHTGSLAGQSQVFDAALRKAGVLAVEDEEHLADLATAFSEQPLPQGRRLAILTNGGGPGIIATDNATEKHGLELASLDPSTADKLAQSLPDEGISLKNPVDIRGDADAALYRATLEAALQDPNVDMAMAVMVAAGPGQAEGIAQAIADLSKQYDKPIVASMMGGEVTRRAREILRENRIPCYPVPSRGTRALGAMADYADIRAAGSDPQVSSLPAPDKARAREILHRAAEQGRKMLTAQDCIDVFRAYNIPVVASQLASSEDEAVRAAAEMGYPVVLKVASEDIVHKKDLGGVQLNLKDEAAVRQAYQTILSNVEQHQPAARLDGIQVMQMARFDGAREIIAGLVHDATFGSTLMTGLGGTYVEVFKDVQFGVAPVSPKSARGLLERLQAYKLLQGTRGEKPSDIEALSQVLARLSELGADLPEIGELDINPFLVYENGVMAVDGRITLRKPT